MPTLLVTTDDFTGTYRLAESIGLTALLQEYIDRYERYYIRQLLGATMGDDFIADKSSPTQDPIYVVLEDAFAMDDNADVIESKGMVDMLVAMIFYHFISETQTNHTQSGIAKQAVETSGVLTPENAFRYAESRFNSALDTVDAIQWYCESYAPEDYPDYNGQEIKPRYSAITKAQE